MWESVCGGAAVLPLSWPQPQTSTWLIGHLQNPDIFRIFSTCLALQMCKRDLDRDTGRHRGCRKGQMGSLDRTFQVMTPTLTCRNTVDSEHFQSTPKVSKTRMKAEMTWNDVLHGQMGANEKSTWI